VSQAKQDEWVCVYRWVDGCEHIPRTAAYCNAVLPASWAYFAKTLDFVKGVRKSRTASQKKIAHFFCCACLL